MKTTFLVLAHNNWHHLTRLCNRLAKYDQPSIVHIDKRSAPPQLDITEQTTVYSKYRCYWAGYSLVEATLDLLRRGLKETDSDYFMLLSGADFPIRPVPELLDFLSRKPGMNYINLWYPGPNPYMNVEERYGHYYLEFDRRRQDIPHKIARRIALQVQKKRRNIPVEIHTGNQWFTIPRKTAEKILVATSKNNIYRRVFKNTYCSDEAFFHTILINENIVVPDINLEPALVYTDWSGSIRPAWIDDSHIRVFEDTKIYKTHYGPQEFFFARKFHDGSTRQLSLIDSISVSEDVKP